MLGSEIEKGVQAETRCLLDIYIPHYNKFISWILLTQVLRVSRHLRLCCRQLWIIVTKTQYFDTSNILWAPCIMFSNCSLVVLNTDHLERKFKINMIGNRASKATYTCCIVASCCTTFIHSLLPCAVFCATFQVIKWVLCAFLVCLYTASSCNVLWRARCRSTVNSKTPVYSRCHATQQWKRPAFSLRSVPVMSSFQQ
jgi:hypothetical protein